MLREFADDYRDTIAHLDDRHRVIVCNSGLQWIIQHRTGETGLATGRWRGFGYFQSQAALMLVCRALCERIDPAALAILAALPEHFGGSA